MSRGLVVLTVVFALIVSTFGFGTHCGADGKVKVKVVPEPTPMPTNLKIAFLGDTGDGSQQRAVYNLVKSWGAVAVIHSGDFDYEDDPATFESNINAVFGQNYPYFASIGNHDEDAWTGYRANLVARLNRVGANRNCTGDYGVNMVCNWNGLFFVLSGVGTEGSNHEEFIDDSFDEYPAVWKFVSWHKNQRLMQIGGKTDETGWDVYDTTRSHGAILVTAHEHSYCRSHIMSNFRTQQIANTNRTLNLRVGESFVFVSGLGGESIRSWDNNLRQNPWWAAVAASNNGVSDGALLCTFNVNGVLRNAHCTFKDRNNNVWDDFDIVSNLPATQEEMEAEMKALKTKEAKAGIKSRCKDWVEVPVAQANDDAEEKLTGEIFCGAKVLKTGKNRMVSLRFENVQLEQGEEVEAAYIQVYGSNHEPTLPDFMITGSFDGSSFECNSEEKNLLSNRKHTSSQVRWQHEDEGWEHHTVWVSPDVSSIVNEIVAQPTWVKGSAIVLNFQGEGKQAFYTFDHTPCHAPTLALDRKC